MIRYGSTAPLRVGSNAPTLDWGVSYDNPPSTTDEPGFCRCGNECPNCITTYRAFCDACIEDRPYLCPDCVVGGWMRV